MQSENPLLADIAKLMNSAAGTVAGMGREARDAARERLKEGLGGLDFVSREEFDTVKEMAAKAREENEKLAERLAALEAALAKQALAPEFRLRALSKAPKPATPRRCTCAPKPLSAPSAPTVKPLLSRGC